MQNVGGDDDECGVFLFGVGGGFPGDVFVGCADGWGSGASGDWAGGLLGALWEEMGLGVWS